jgi:hypothetical protein
MYVLRIDLEKSVNTSSRKISFGGSKKYAELTHMVCEVCDEAGCTHTSEPKIHQ